MTEDIDKDLEDFAEDLDLGGDADAEASGDADSSDDLDLGGADLDDLDFGDADSSDAEASGDDLDLGGADLGGDADGGDDLNLDDELQSMLDSESGPGGDSTTDDPGDAISTESAGPPVPVQPALPDLDEEQTVNLEFLLDIKLHVTFEVGRSKMLISDLLTLGQGSVIELHRLVGDELDMLVNGRLVAKGEVVVINEKFGCKISEIIPPLERVKHMGGI